MICLKPNQKIRKNFPNIDFEILSCVYTILFDSVYKVKKRRNFKIDIVKVAGINSYYMFQAGTDIKIRISEVIRNDAEFHTCLLHEFRHFVQDKVFKIPLTKANYDESTDKSYHHSPVEIDARHYEKVTYSKVMQLYNRLSKFKNYFIINSEYTVDHLEKK